MSEEVCNNLCEEISQLFFDLGRNDEQSHRLEEYVLETVKEALTPKPPEGDEHV